MKFSIFPVVFILTTLLIASPVFSQIYIPAKVDLKGVMIGKTTKKEILKKYGKPSSDEKVMGFRRAKKKEGNNNLKLKSTCSPNTVNYYW